MKPQLKKPDGVRCYVRLFEYTPGKRHRRGPSFIVYNVTGKQLEKIIKKAIKYGR